MRPQPPSPRQRDALVFIINAMNKSGVAPSIREIGEALGLRSTNATNDLLKALERKGLVRRGTMLARALVPTPAAFAFVRRKPRGDSDIRALAKRIVEQWSASPGVALTDVIEAKVLEFVEAA